ncbi:response regulator [Mucilaginibacter sp. AW1-3]
MSNLNIYIVEDEPLISASLKHIILGAGHKIIGIAASYDQAIHDLQKSNVHLVVTDIMLEGTKTGVDLAKYINENLKIPFIYQSSVSDPEIINDALKTGPLAYLVKPVNKMVLLNAIATIPNT